MIRLGNFIPSRIPAISRRGDGLGCRKHNFCRHGAKWKRNEHPRVVSRRRSIRTARKSHPRNLA